MTSISATGLQAQAISRILQIHESPENRVWVFAYDEYILVEVEDANYKTILSKRVWQSGRIENMAITN